MKKKASPSAPTSLADFALAERRAARRAACAVCALPDELRTQIREARDKKIDRPTVRRWLLTNHRIRIDDAAFDQHGGGHHDRKDA